MPDYLCNKPIDLLIASALRADDFNDDSLGRSLDDVYEAGVTELFARVASNALKVCGIRYQFVHLDRVVPSTRTANMKAATRTLKPSASLTVTRATIVRT